MSTCAFFPNPEQPMSKTGWFGKQTESVSIELLEQLEKKCLLLLNMEVGLIPFVKTFYFGICFSNLRARIMRRFQF